MSVHRFITLYIRSLKQTVSNVSAELMSNGVEPASTGVATHQGKTYLIAWKRNRWTTVSGEK